jgi:putative endonuclease
MNFSSYVIYSTESGLFYYGYFDDLEKVLEMHNSGQIEVTRGKGPWQLMFSETFDNRVRAIRQSRFYRTVKGQRFLKKILNF